MFSIFKFNPETQEVQELRSAFDPVTARSNQHQACNHCHAKKLRCSGEKNGCERCAASQLPCEYTRPNSRSSRRGRKANRRSPVDSRSRDTTSGRDSSPSSQTSKSSRHSRRRCRSTSTSSSGSSSKHPKHRRHSGGSKSLRSPEKPQHDGSALGQLDLSMLAPEDGFDLRSLSMGHGGSGGGMMASPGGAAYEASSMAAFPARMGDYYGQFQATAGGWQTAASQPTYIDGGSPAALGPLYTDGATGHAEYGNSEYYGNYPDFTQYQPQHDPRDWPEGP